jgi:hypothetical protein
LLTAQRFHLLQQVLSRQGLIGEDIGSAQKRHSARYNLPYFVFAQAEAFKHSIVPSIACPRPALEFLLIDDLPISNRVAHGNAA